MKINNGINTPTFRAFRTILAFSLVMLSGVFVYGGGAGTLDFTFNGTGYKFDGFGGGYDWGQKAVAQPDGKIIVVGYTERGSPEMRDVAVARYQPNGTFDTSFGNGGKLVIPVSVIKDQANSAAIQPDGKIVVAGVAPGNGDNFLLLRLNPNGTVDQTFGNNGKVITQGTGIAYDVVIQPNGKIVAAGISGAQSVLARYDSNGSLDAAFGNGGIVYNSIVAVAFSMALQPDGKVVTAGSTGVATSSNTALARYNSDGSPDTTFDTDGSVITDVMSGSDAAYSVALQADGKIVTAGPLNISGSYDFALLRYNANGSLDNSFDGDGIFTASIQGNDEARTVAVQPDGKIIAAGRTWVTNQHPNFGVIRCNPDGTLDNTFGSGGKVSTDLSSSTYYADFDWANSAVILPTGKIVAAGISRHGQDDFGLVQYNPDGSLDIGFNGSGKLLSDVGNANYLGVATVVQPDGKIVTAVNAGIAGARFTVVRYNADGSADLSFGAGGKTEVLFETFGIAVPYDITLQADGKIVVTGGVGDLRRVALARFNADGSPDTTFDGDGKVVSLILNYQSEAHAAAIGPDGKIVIAGDYQNLSEGGLWYAAVVRYNADGSLDSSFDGDGVYGTRSIGSIGKSLVIQPDGKIVAGGDGPNGYTFALVRLNTDGSVDPSFGSAGVVNVSISGIGPNQLSSLALMTDGRIVAGGFTANVPNGASYNFAVARFNPNGSLDTSFDGDGKVITPITGSDLLRRVRLQSDGKIVVAGGTNHAGSQNFILTRYNVDGSLDSSYGSGGIAMFDLGYNDDAFGLALDPVSNKAIVVGKSYNFLTARIMADDAPLVDIGGRVTNANGNGIANVSISIGNNVDNPRYTITNGLGYYVFPAMPSNEVYIISTSSKRYSFLPDAHTVSVTSTYWNGDFVGTPYNNRNGAVKGTEKITVKPTEAGSKKIGNKK